MAGGRLPMSSTNTASVGSAAGTASNVVPSGVLKFLSVDDVKPSATNPRKLFDKLPLDALRDNIRINGVLVPITVYRIKGQDKYAILDGQRRYQCCIDLREEGVDIEIPANIVEPPDKIAGILYMFSIHNFREQWELMPTALSLKTVMEALQEEENERLARITGLSEPQLERCKMLLTFPVRFQNLSLDPNPRTRIPANFWIEAYPVLNVCEEVLPDLVEEIGRDGITDRLVEKYRARKIRSILHFRRIMEAVDVSDGDADLRAAVVERLEDFLNDIEMETRSAFDEFIMDPRRIRSAIDACDSFMSSLRRAKLQHISERDELVEALTSVQRYVGDLLTRLEGGDAPQDQDEDAEQEGG
jgi:ParB family chromosome partitioning protein